MKKLIYEDKKGVMKADSHYLETGHKINQENEWNTKGNKQEIIKRYKCSQCNFNSAAGEIYEQLFS